MIILFPRLTPGRQKSMTTKEKEMTMKKQLSGLLALLLLLTACVGCGSKTPDAPKGIYYDVTGIDPAQTVLELDGNTIPAELYFYWLGYSCSNVEYQLQMFSSYYGLYTELVNEDGSVVWDGDLEGNTPAKMAQETAESSALSYLVLENMAKEYGVTLTDEDRAELDETLSAQIEQNGGEEAFQQSLELMGISRESLERIYAANYLFAHLQDIAADPSSDLYEAPSETDNAYVDHILLMTVDSETREPLSEEEIAAKRTQAEELLAQLQAADDVEALFGQLVTEYGEDPGREAETGYLINPETNFVQEFKDAAFALKPGEISGIVESDYGYHIILRKALTESQIASLAGSHLSTVLDERMESVQPVRNEVLDSVDAGKFYTDYRAAAQAIQDANAPEEDGSAGDSAPEDGGADGAADSGSAQ